MQLVASLLESLLLTCFSNQTSSFDATSGVPSSVPPTPAPDLKRRKSVSSSSGMERVECESLPSESVSSTAFSQIQQVLYHKCIPGLRSDYQFFFQAAIQFLVHWLRDFGVISR